MHKNELAAAMTPEALAMLGAEQMAYVRPALIDGQTVYLVFRADGQQIGGFADRNVAFAACRQHELEPVSVH